MPLYEAMRSGARRPSGAGPTPAGGDLEVRFGGVVRLPAGVLLLGIAGVLVILVLAYAAGYARAGAEADRRIEQLMLEHRADLGDARFAATGRPAAGDPGPDRRGGSESSPRTGGPSGTPSRPSDSPAASPASPATSPAAPGSTPALVAAGGWQRPPDRWWDDPFRDPITTTPGPWYWSLMVTSREGAGRFIDFARSRGLETYAVPVNTGRSPSYRVYVVPGLHTNSPDHEWHEPMRAFIRRIGEEWASQPGSGGDSLDDASLHYFG